VFTHVLPQGMENYLGEITRVLKPRGRCLITYFVLTPESVRLMGGSASSLSFRYEASGCRLQEQDVPEAAVAYTESRIRELYASHDLHVTEPIRFGSWCGRENGLSYQDIIVARKGR
jgi:hypothetical protein